MGIVANQDILASDFIYKSEANPTPANDEGRVPKLETSGQLSPVFVPSSFGGDGSDGELNISSGTTTVDVGGARVFILNYSKVSITGTAVLAFSNPHDDGTVVILKSQRDVVITSTATQCIDVRNMGGKGGAGQVTGSGGQAGWSPYGRLANETMGGGLGADGSGGGGGGSAGVTVTSPLYSFVSELINLRKNVHVLAGAGGGGGGFGWTNVNGSGSAGGRGGGGLLIQCAGALNFTGTINSSGTDAIANPYTAPNAAGGGGGGGSAGFVVILYNSLTANTGTITATGGAGGTGGTGGSTTGTQGGGGGGGGSIFFAGGAGGGGSAGAGSAGAGVGAGGGGGAGRDGAGAGGAGGAGGASMGGLVLKNSFL